MNKSHTYTPDGARCHPADHRKKRALGASVDRASMSVFAAAAGLVTESSLPIQSLHRRGRAAKAGLAVERDEIAPLEEN
jgi:hypothetical protein